HDGSLRKPIEQMKTALFYPNGGLPLLITGDSGTGKSYMAELMHEFAIAQPAAARLPYDPVEVSRWRERHTHLDPLCPDRP
ncbi:sigma 54-interacting transcriptional regulator, partial [Mycobacterium tuberculosis]|nr:sigma 54-interacting transcriptional regulator [Mycobacterium tuberculosis]